MKESSVRLTWVPDMNTPTFIMKKKSCMLKLIPVAIKKLTSIIGRFSSDFQGVHMMSKWYFAIKSWYVVQVDGNRCGKGLGNIVASGSEG